MGWSKKSLYVIATHNNQHRNLPLSICPEKIGLLAGSNSNNLIYYRRVGRLSLCNLPVAGGMISAMSALVQQWPAQSAQEALAPFARPISPPPEAPEALLRPCGGPCPGHFRPLARQGSRLPPADDLITPSQLRRPTHAQA